MMNRTVTPRRRLNRTGPSAARLEPRIVFDGAAPVDAATALADAAAAVAAPPEPTLADLPPAVHDQAQDHAPPAVRLASDTASTDADVASLAAIDQQARDIIATYLGGSDGIEALFTVFRGGEDVAQGPSAEWAERAQSLLDAIAGGDFGVTFQVLDGDQIGGAHAAFTATGPTGEPTIFINGEWWAAQTDTSVLARTLVEEYGHAFDHALNGDADTAGDEGEAFAAAATGSHVTIIDEARIAAEDDHGIATVDGTDYVVERASISFINAYRVYTGDGFPAEKEQNLHHYVDEALGVTNIDDMVSSTYFSGNDVVVQMTIDGNTYYGWVSRPIKSGGVVRGFYFWTDSDFATLQAATNDGNADGDRNTTDNAAFILVVDQAYFDSLAVVGQTGGKDYKFVGSSSDRVDSALNALVVPNTPPTPGNDSLSVPEDSGATTGNVLGNDTDADNEALTVTGFTIGGAAGTLGQPFTIAGVGQFTLSATGAYCFTPAADYAGPVPAVTYSVADTAGGSSTATLAITVTPINDAPAGADRTITVFEDQFHAFTAADFALSDAADTPADALRSVVVTRLPAAGTLTLDGIAVTAGQEIMAADIVRLRFTPAADAHGNDYATFTFQVRDTGGTAGGGLDLDPTPNTITIHVTNANDGPTASPDTTQIDQGTASVTGTIATNDSDPDGDSRSVIAVSGVEAASGTGPFVVAGRYGTLTLQADGIYSYALDNSLPEVQALAAGGATLSDVFSYTIADPTGLTAASTLTITIRGLNDAPQAADDVGVAKESTAASGNYGVGDATGFTASGNVLGNDNDADGASDTLSVIGLAASALGTTAGSGVTTLTFTPGNNTLSNVQSGYYAFVEVGGVRTALVDAQGTHLQIATGYPTTVNGVYVIALTGQPSAALPDGSLVGFASTTNGSHGTYRGGTIASADQEVAAASTITISAASGGIATGMTVTGTDADGVAFTTTVTAVQYAGDGSVSQVTLATALRLGNTPLSFTATAGSTVEGRYGTLSLDAQGAYTYTPTANNPALSDGDTVTESFQYYMQDASGATSSATLVITVLGSGSNDPDARPDVAEVTEDTAVAAIGNVITPNDTTPAGTSGLVVASARGTGASLTAVATGTVIAGRYGTLTISSDGSYSYIADDTNPAVDALRTASDTLTDVFVYTLRNDQGGQDAATLSITLRGANDVPIAAVDTAVAIEAGGIANATPGSAATGTVLVNDGDTDAGDSLSVGQVEAGSAITGGASAVAGGTTSADGTAVAGAYGTLTLGADGTYDYVINDALPAVQALAPGQSLSDTFAYTVRDSAGLTSEATLTITIQGANDAPENTVPGVGVILAEEATATIAGLQVADVDHTTLTVQLSVQSGILHIGALSGSTLAGGANGSASVTLSGTKAQLDDALATLSYQGQAGFNGTDALTMRTTDGGGLQALSTLGITVTPDARSVTVSSTTVNEGSPYLLFQVQAVAGQALTLALEASGSGNGHVTIGTDLLPGLEVFNGTAWIAYDGGFVTVPAGDILLVRAAVTGDSISEGAETVRLVALNKAAIRATGTGTGTIVDDGSGDIYLAGTTTPDTGSVAYLDDDRPLSVNDIVVNEASPYAMFTVSGNAGQIVRLALLDGTAAAVADYASALEYFDGGSWVGYTAGSDIAMTGGTLLVRTALVNDGTFEGQEAFTLGVTRMNSGGRAFGTASIYDDGTGAVYLGGNTTGTPNEAGDSGFPAALDDDRTITVSSPVVNEASDYAVFTLSGNSGQTVTLALVNQTGTIDTSQTLRVWDGLDWVAYDPAAALPTFDANGRILVRVDITAEHDAAHEGAETFVLQASLTGRSGTTEGTGTIVDDGTGVIHSASGAFQEITTGLEDDRSAGIAHVRNGAGDADGVTVVEGQSAAFTVTLTAPSGQAETFTLALAGGTATAGSDLATALTFSNGVTYDAATGLVTVPAGVTSFTVTVPTVDDATVETTEAFTLTVGGVAATGTILDNDSIGVDSVAPVSVTEGGDAVFTVTLDTGSTSPETFTLALAGGTATAGSDLATALTFSNGVTYDAATGLVTVPAGVTSFTVTVPTVDDATVETAEAFTLSVGGVAATGTILDNDKMPAKPVVLQPPAPPAPPLAVSAAPAPYHPQPPANPVGQDVPAPLSFGPLVASNPLVPFDDAQAQHDLRVDKAIPDVIVPPGSDSITYVIPVDAFVHTDSAAKVNLVAAMVDGSDLPAWLSFDPKKREFTGYPPPGFSGELLIKIVARDEVGRQAETLVRIKVDGKAERVAALSGKEGLSAQFQAQGVAAWKANRDALVRHARDAALTARQMKADVA